MANILVTGGAGYIGSQVCKRLAEQGHTPVTYDNLCRGHRELVKWGPLIEGDIHDQAQLIYAMRSENVAAVIHLAAYAYIQESVKNPEMYYENNVNGSALLLMAMQEAEVKKLVFSSTCAVYGEARKPLIAEDHPTQPINPYGASKLMVEKFIEQYQTDGLLQACSLRYFNAAGADPELETGEWHEPEPHIIPNMLHAANNGEPLTLNGDDYDTKDGTCVRDFIHVCDLAEAHLLVLQRLLQNRPVGTLYNVGQGQGFSLLELAEAVVQETGKPLNLRKGPRRPGDPAFLVADCQRFKDDFRWNPSHSDLQTILQTAIEWNKTMTSTLEIQRP